MKSGFVSIIGKTNAGKSTLLNQIVKSKVSIVTHKQQTTRNAIQGIYNDEDSQIVFIEAKKTELNLHDLGQLWAYCKLCDPAEAFLLSSLGMGSLNKILNNLCRLDLLDFGDGRRIKKMQVGKWDITSNMIDSKTLVPKL